MAGESAGGALGSYNPYAAAFSAVANSPPPSSTATSKTTMPITFNNTGLNLGSILQPYQQAPANGGYGMAASPMGYYGGMNGLTGLGIKPLYLYIGVGLLAVYMFMRK